MRFTDAVELGCHVAFTKKTRFFLSVLGVVIGVAAVILVVAIGHAGQSHIQKELETFGENSIWIWRDTDQRRILKHAFTSNPYEISMEDVDPIRSSVAGVRDVAAVLSEDGELQTRRSVKQVDVMGVTDNFFKLNNETLRTGRLFRRWDDESHPRVAVVSYALEEFLQKVQPTAVGTEITLRGEKFLVVGVLEKKDRPFINMIRSAGRGDFFEVYVPLSVTRRWLGTNNLSYIQIQSEPDAAARVVENTLTLLKVRHRQIPEFKSESMEQYAKTSGKILAIIQIILSAAALISLVVGGIGIMNMMIVSVTERTREIGVRKAMGATGGDILFQFLIEAVLVTLFGGAGGVVLALIGVSIVATISGVPGLLYGPAVFLALGVSIVTGLLAGIYPAWQASRLDPAVALRYE